MKKLISTQCVILALLFAGNVSSQEAESMSITGSVAPVNQVLLTVNGEPVRMSDISTAAQGVASAAARNGMQITQEQILELATAQVVDAILLAQQAKKEQVTVDRVEVGTALQDIVKRAGSRENLDAQLANTGMTFDLLREGIETTMLARAYVDQKIRPGISVSDEEANAYYDENPQYFARPEQVRASHILMTTGEGADDEAKAAAKAKAEAARKRALDGEDFATLAKEVSEGPSGPNGGDLGWFSADQMVKAFTDAAFSTEPGEISEVVETQFGFHVIRVEERRPAMTMPYEDVVQNIKLNLIERKVAEGAEAVLEPIREKAEVVPVAQVAQDAATPEVEE